MDKEANTQKEAENAVEKDKVEKEESPKQVSISKWAWFPFMLVFLSMFLVFLLSFLQNPIQIYTISIDKVSFGSQTEHHYVQLVMLIALLGISMMIPGWVASVKRPRINNNYPLGLPKGSVRAILALVTMGAYVALLLQQNAFDEAKNVLLLVLAFYFISRAAEVGISNDK